MLASTLDALVTSPAVSAQRAYRSSDLHAIKYGADHRQVDQ
jgi:hypothetical protein